MNDLLRKTGGTVKLYPTKPDYQRLAADVRRVLDQQARNEIGAEDACSYIDQLLARWGE